VLIGGLHRIVFRVSCRPRLSFLRLRLLSRKEAFGEQQWIDEVLDGRPTRHVTEQMARLHSSR